MAELAILAGLAAAGYTFSRSDSTQAPTVLLPEVSRHSPYPPPSGAAYGSIASETNAPPPPNDDSIAAIMQEIAQGNGSRLEMAIDPTNQPIAGDRRFFFTSSKSQAYRPEVTQRKMELFTGANKITSSATGVWQPKRESGARFAPASGQAAVTSGGHGTMGVGYNRAEYERFLTQKQNNVVPTPQMQVGPGMGIPISQPAGNGYHYSLSRILPRNINQHRLNRDLKGRIGGGKSRVTNRSTMPNLVKSRPVKFWTLDRVPLAPGRATATAHTKRSKEPRFVCFGTKRDPEPTGYMGVATHALTKEGPLPAQQVRATRPESRCDDVWPLPSLNVTMHASTKPHGAYAKESFDCSRFINQQREQTFQKEGQGFIGGVTQHGTLPTTSYAMAPTKRSIKPSFGCKNT